MLEILNNIYGRNMWRFKVIFVLIIVNHLDSIQNKAYGIDDNPTTVPEITTLPPKTNKKQICEDKSKIKGTACKVENNLNVTITWTEFVNENRAITKIISENPDENCCEFKKIEDSFFIDQDCIGAQCNYQLFSEVGKTPYHLPGLFLRSIFNKCPTTDEIFCVLTEASPIEPQEDSECPVTNFDVNSVYVSDYNFISLNITWDPTTRNDTVSIKIDPNINANLSNCYYTTHSMHLNLGKRSYTRPPIEAPPDREIEPDCVYDITMEPMDAESLGDSNATANYFKCNLTYVVPECVEKKCNCRKYNPQSKILAVEHISEDQFFVKWTPGETTANNSTYIIENVHFYYTIKSAKMQYVEPKILQQNLKDHTTKMTMKLFNGDNYTLKGIFKNNFSCLNEVTFEFTAPGSSNRNFIIFGVVAVVLVIVALSRRTITKYTKKLLGILMPRYNQMLTQNNDVQLTPLKNNHIPMNTNIQYTPIEFLEGRFDEYEFPRHKLTIKEAIGSGAFGHVYSAKAIGIGGVEGYKMVAVKTLGEGENITREATNDFIAEIEIFKKIGQHPNIVALLGCCTLEAPYMMIMEFVPCGDLKKYLLDLRDQWLIKKNKQVFFPDNSDGAYIQAPTPSSPTSSVTSSRLPSTSETVCTTLEDPMTPLLAHYTQALDRVLDHTELQNFALQIAKGMSHLEKIPITHRDLAARNILINEYKTLKISDFGLSRNGPYINHKSKKLPLRWMAIEAIIDQKYDSKSDVWSFGIVLWEIGTLGAFPYESVPDSFILQFLQMGRRLERPEICTDELYSLMKQCWATDADKRPTFQELVDVLDVKKQKIYVNFSQLNPTYVFPPSEIKHCVENPVQIVNIDI